MSIVLHAVTHYPIRGNHVAARHASGAATATALAPATTTPTTTTATTSTSSSTTPPATTPPATPVPDFRALFTGTVTPDVPAPATPPAPTAESVFGPNPWMNPVGMGPTGMYTMNPFYFATPQTAAKIAALVGGTVVQSNQFTPNGGAFMQMQANQMVQLPDGRVVNPGLIASFYTHGYPQSYIDQMIAAEIRPA